MTQNKKSGVEEEKQNEAIETGNNLFPIFLKLEKLRLLIVGGGKVALEKLHAVLQNSPATQITMVAVEFTEPTRNTAGNNLFPIFLKLEKLRLLIVGGGKVALEKLHAVLQNSIFLKQLF